jgi:hypothetical protein
MNNTGHHCVTPTVLVLTSDPSLRDILGTTLLERGMRFQASDSYDDVDINFCLIIAGPDKNASEIGTRLREIGGIPPCILLLRNEATGVNPIRCCRCKTLFLPMDIFHLPRALDQLLAFPD